MFDLDNLKALNDTGGHSKGDRMIRTFADLLRRNTRNGDILCRYSGDEFLVILKQIDKEETAVSEGEKICGAFNDFIKQTGESASCTAGVALCGINEIPSAELIDRADQALYRAKHRKKGIYLPWRK